MNACLWFAGTPAFAAHSLQALIDSDDYRIDVVLSQPDRPVGRGRKPGTSAVKQTALAHGIPVAQPEKLQAGAPPFAGLPRPDLIIVVAYGLLLPPWFLEYPRLGCINIHASLLPRWRGAAPIQRAIEAGDRETGICIMQMDQGLDTGAIWQRATLTITADDNAATLHDRLMHLGSATLLQTLPDILAQTRTPEPQVDEGANYAHKLGKEEARLDWQQPIDILARKIRAYNPVPVAHSALEDKTLRIYEAHIHNHNPGAPAGHITAHHADGLDVACRDGTLRITRVQLPGKNITAAAELRHSRDLTGKTLT